MMANGIDADIYLIHVWIRKISPMIWRRLLVRSDSTIADLHNILQIAFDLSDAHLNLFHIHGQDYGVYHEGGVSFSTDPYQVRLCDFKFRVNERFLYEYDFNDYWRHEVRVEARLAAGKRHHYPCCIGGQRRSPPEDCGGPLAFMMRRDEVPLQVDDLYEEIRANIETGDLESIRDLVENLEELSEWLALDKFDRRAVNRRLKQYATDGEAAVQR
jgi:hypothetical protein